MAKQTIAQTRERALENFNSQYINNLDTAKNLVNRFYRLSGICNRLLYVENDEKRCNSRYARELHAQCDKAEKKLNDDLQKYGLSIRYFSWLPAICESGSTCEALSRFYYN